MIYKCKIIRNNKVNFNINIIKADIARYDMLRNEKYFKK